MLTAEFIYVKKNGTRIKGIITTWEKIKKRKTFS